MFVEISDVPPRPQTSKRPQKRCEPDALSSVTNSAWTWSSRTRPSPSPGSVTARDRPTADHVAIWTLCRTLPRTLDHDDAAAMDAGAAPRHCFHHVVEQGDHPHWVDDPCSVEQRDGVARADRYD